MKKHLFDLIYSFLYWIDEKCKFIKGYDYETMPYCGHHHSGHDGYFTQSHFHEGDGTWEFKTWLLCGIGYTDAYESAPGLYFKWPFTRVIFQKQSSWLNIDINPHWYGGTFNSHIVSFNVFTGFYFGRFSQFTSPYLLLSVKENLIIIHLLGWRCQLTPKQFTSLCISKQLRYAANKNSAQAKNAK